MESPDARHTVGDILDRFAAEHVPTLAQRTQKDYARHIARLRARFGSIVAGDVSRNELLSYLNDPQAAPYQREREMSVLRKAFGLAVRQWHWLRANPSSLLEKGKPKKSARRYISGEEFAKVKASAPKSVQFVMDLARVTGQPQGSIIELRWSDVDETNGFVAFWNPKLRKKELIPLTPELRGTLALCRELSSGPQEYVIYRRLYGGRYTSEGFRALWQRVIKKFPGPTRFNFHDIAYTWECDQRNDAVPARVQALLDMPRESLAVELKRWMVLTDPPVRASVARHLAALANHGGGFLIFGFEEDGTLDKNHPGDLSSFNHDEFAGIIDKYLSPAFHCDVYIGAPSGASEKCVVVQVPSNVDVPVCSKADGPHDQKNRPLGIQIARYYVRVNGPKSEPIKTPEEWRPLIHRCVLQARQQLLQGLLQAIQQQLGPPDVNDATPSPKRYRKKK